MVSFLEYILPTCYDTTLRPDLFKVDFFLEIFNQFDDETFSNLLQRYSSGPNNSVVLITLVYRIEVHARLLILRKKSPLHGPILVCTFIVFEKKIPLHVYFPAFVLAFALYVY